MHRSGDEDEDAEPENCAAPLTCKEKVFREKESTDIFDILIYLIYLICKEKVFRENRDFTFLLCFRISSDITTTFTMGSRPSMWQG